MLHYFECEPFLKVLRSFKCEPLIFREIAFISLFFCDAHGRIGKRECMDFYRINEEYSQFLQKYEEEKRGFTKVPNIRYTDRNKFAFGAAVVILRFWKTDTRHT